MAVWVKLHLDYSWKTISEIAKKHQLEIGNWQNYNIAKLNQNWIRIGFASYYEEEIYELINRFKKIKDEIKNSENFT